MKDFSEEIELAKQEIQRDAHKIITNWFVSQWDTGFVVCDYDPLKQLSKRKLNAILSLGIQKGDKNEQRIK